MRESALPPAFQFSQSCLQDYVDCPRRFELLHMLRQAWPAVQAQPMLEHELLVQRGTAFHRLAHQRTIGIPIENLTGSIADEDLRRWWQAYLDEPPPDLPTEMRLAEVTLYIPLGQYRLIAKYDLMAADSERVVVVDWKTGKHRPASSWLARRLQTRVYPFVAVEAGSGALNMPDISPGQVSMVYWFAEFPHQAEWLEYNGTVHEENRIYLAGLVDDISTRSAGDFPLTGDERHCRFCVYRSLCERELPAGEMNQLEDMESGSSWTDRDIDFEQVTEIAY